MGNWYRVTKKIHGRYYDYWQRTERHGRSVKTFNKYIGPSGVGIVSAPTSITTTPLQTRPESIPSSTLSPPTISTTAPRTPEDALSRLTPPPIPNAVDLREEQKIRQRGIWDWENVKYGSIKQRTNRAEIKRRAATRIARGTGTLNPFLGQAINRLKEARTPIVSKVQTSGGSPIAAERRSAKTSSSRRKKQLPPFPKDGNFSDPFWDTPSTPTQLRDQAQVFYAEYRRLCAEFNNRRFVDQLSAFIPFSSSEDAAERLEIRSIKSKLDWYQSKAQSHFDYNMQFAQSGKVRLSRQKR